MSTDTCQPGMTWNRAGQPVANRAVQSTNTSPNWKSQNNCFANSSHDAYRSGSGFVSHESSTPDGAAFTRYGGIDASTDAFRSTHTHAVSVNAATRPPAHDVPQPSGQPAHGCGGGGGFSGTNGPGDGSTTPSGSPGASVGIASGGRIARVNQPMPLHETTGLQAS